jgi:hypothetical protein
LVVVDTGFDNPLVEERCETIGFKIEFGRYIVRFVRLELQVYFCKQKAVQKTRAKKGSKQAQD